MKQWFYPTAYSVWGDEERAAIDRVHTSGRYTQGEEVAGFEGEFAEWHGMKYGIMVNSGSSANLIAIAAMCHRQHTGRPLNAGDKVIVPAIAWSTTYAPLEQYGLDLVVADVNDQWNVGQYHGEPAISAQIVCSILGNPAHFWAEAPWPIIEDNCESMGAVDLKGRLCGTRGVLNTFSLFYSHQLSAIEGGMILTNNDELARLCKVLRAHGWTRDVDGGEFHFEREYRFTHFGYNVRGLEMHAAIAREQLKKLPAMIVERQKNFDYFKRCAHNDQLPVKFPEVNGVQSPFGIPFELVEPHRRKTLARRLRENGIDCRLPTGGSFLMHPYSGKYFLGAGRTPRADAIHRAGMFLGNAPLDLTEQINKAINVMREVLR